MPFCSNCGNNLGANGKFCSECGTAVSSAPPPSSTPSSSSISNKYLPGSLGSGGNIDQNLGLMLGHEKGAQPIKYSVETRVVKQNRDACTSCGLVTPNLFEDGGKPFCENCLKESGKADVCFGCGKAILNGAVKKVKDVKYHPECLKCHTCSQVLSGSFANKGGKYVCKSCAGN